MTQTDAEILLNEIFSNGPTLIPEPASVPRAFPEVQCFNVEADLDVDFDFGSFMDLDTVSVTAEGQSVAVVPTTDRLGGLQAVVWKITMKSGATVVLRGDVYRQGDETRPVHFAGMAHVIDDAAVADFYMVVEIAMGANETYQRWESSAKDVLSSLADLLKSLPPERAVIVAKNAAAALKLA